MASASQARSPYSDLRYSGRSNSGNSSRWRLVPSTLDRIQHRPADHNPPHPTPCGLHQQLRSSSAANTTPIPLSRRISLVQFHSHTSIQWHTAAVVPAEGLALTPIPLIQPHPLSLLHVPLTASYMSTSQQLQHRGKPESVGRSKPLPPNPDPVSPSCTRIKVRTEAKVHAHLHQPLQDHGGGILDLSEDLDKGQVDTRSINEPAGSCQIQAQALQPAQPLSAALTSPPSRTSSTQGWP
ncbi:zinc finger protein GLI2 isoform X2 [Lates japonicus]|uniref:Zinc finger protein GLI2 isoform X2 n=1 Tax=Lates japonicus TaxID=270547 RepID=A0AAD3MTZ8_LATJO|nr:zinc finger protein GLI2 isoform X2 [Lates japonicus]